MAELEQEADRSRPHTVAAVFEDAIDGGHALGAVRKAGREPESVSIVLRVGADSMGEIDVGDAVAKSGLNGDVRWLHGLAIVVAPGRGTFLVGGPLGAIVARARGFHGAGEVEFRSLLQAFGFSDDEAAYLDKRLAAGAPLVAVSTRAGETPSVVRRLLADQDAVFIGTVETAEPALETAQDLLEARLIAASVGVVKVADAVANLRRVGAEGGPASVASLLGQKVVDVDGGEVGEVDDALVEVYDPDGRGGPLPEEQVLRYLVVGHGGVFGIGRRRTAVPTTLADLQTRPVSLTVGRDLIHAAPPLEDKPFSRHEEQAVADHFGIRAYWLDDAPA